MAHGATFSKTGISLCNISITAPWVKNMPISSLKIILVVP